MSVRMARIAIVTLLVAAALVAGVITGVAIGRRDGEVDPPEVSNAGAQRMRVREKIDPVEELTPQPPVPARPAVTLSEVLEAIPAPEVPPGNGTISGRVYTDAGAPLEDVEIVAKLQLPTEPVTRHCRQDKMSVEEQIYNFARQIRRERISTFTTRTDQSGLYSLTALPETGKYRLSASKKGYSIDMVGSHFGPEVRVGATVNFLAIARFRVPISVLMPDGTQPRQAKIRISEESGGWNGYSWQPARPEISLGEGRYVLYALVDEEVDTWSLPCDYEAMWKSEEQTIVLSPGQDVPSLTFRVKRRNGIEGTISFTEEDDAAMSVHVYILRQGNGLTLDDQALLSRGKTANRSPWNRNRYSFRDIEPGMYLVGVVDRWNKILVSALVQVADDIVVQNFLVPPSDKRNSLVVHLRTPDGTRPRQVSFRIGYRTDDHRDNESFCTAIRRKDGSFLLPHPRAYYEKQGTEGKAHRYYVVAESEEFGTKEVELPTPETEGLVVAFETPAMLDVTLGNYVGSGHEWAIAVFLAEADEAKEDEDWILRASSRAQDKDDLSPEGRQSFGPLQPGDYVVAVCVSDKQWPLLVEQVPVSVRPGRTEVVIPMPALYSLTILISTQNKYAHVYLTRKDKNGYYSSNVLWEEVKGRRAITVEHLPAGEYEVGLEVGKNIYSRKVSLPGTSIVQLEERSNGEE